MLLNAVKTDVVNGLYCELPLLAQIQDQLVKMFPHTTFRHTSKFVTDIFDPNEQMEIITQEHDRAHRASQENVKQILNDYFFPRMEKKAKEIASNCRICVKAKYDRHPVKHPIGETPIPSFPGEILHIDIFSTNATYFLTCVDKLSKFAVVQYIPSRTIDDIKPRILQLVNLFAGSKTIFCDNEKSLNSNTIRSCLRDFFNIEIVNTPPLHSVSNGQVERFHSTIGEIARCLKLEKGIEDTTDLILLATVEYNRSIHSVTGQKPLDVFHSRVGEMRETKNRVEKAQEAALRIHNKNRSARTFSVGEKVHIKSNKRLGNKLTPLYVEGVVQEDLGSSIRVNGRIVHKDNIR